MAKETLQEIEIFSEEQLNILPKEAKESIISLNAGLNTKELLVLNPMVAELLKIKELIKIKFVPLPENPTKEDKAKFKENIAEFKSAKSSIVAFKKQSAEAKKAIKGPLDLLGKQVIVVEKSVNEIASEVADLLDKEFKPYLDEEQEKKDAAAEKKRLEEQKAINELSEQNKAQSDLIAKGQILTYLKYEMLEGTKRVVAGAIQHYTLDAAQDLLRVILAMTFENTATGKDLTLLDAEELLACQTSFFNQRLEMTSSLNARIKILELEKENEKLEEKIETVTATPPPIYQGVSNISVTGQIETGAPLEPEAFVAARINQSLLNNNSDLKSVVNGLIVETINDIDFNIDLFIDLHNADATEEQVEDVRRCKGAIKLLEKTILYINNQLPKTE